MTNEKRLIDAERLKRILQNMVRHLKAFRMHRTARLFESFIKYVNWQPTVDAVEVVHGRWKPTGDPVLDNIYGVAVCSVCGYEYAGNNTNYCPNCGAKMNLEAT